MRVTAGVTEELGSEIMVIFTIDAPRVEHACLAQAAEAFADEDEAAAALVGGKSLWTARVSKDSRVRHEAPLELAVDTRYLQFFDPPEPEIPPSPQILQRVMDYDADWEATD